MTIKEVEKQTGLARSNIRFYEKEKLIEPSRDETNGYRVYSKSDVENIKKIAYLRTLGISVEDIRKVISEKISLQEAVRKQSKALESQITDLNNARVLCEKMLNTPNTSFADLQVERYVAEIQDYWKSNQPVFKLDSVSFLYVWSDFIIWTAITALCLFIGILFYPKLPPEIPVQWNDGAATSLADKKMIFAYPAVCVAVRLLLRPLIYTKLRMSGHYAEVITEYLTNYICFIVLSVEVFSILFVYGAAENIVAVLLVDTIVFIGILIIGMVKLGLIRIPSGRLFKG